MMWLIWLGVGLLVTVVLVVISAMLEVHKLRCEMIAHTHDIVTRREAMCKEFNRIMGEHE
jgi:cell division protein FtsL